MLLSGCTPEELALSTSLQHYHVLQTSVMALSFGAMLGQFVEWTFFVNTGELVTSHWTWWRTSIPKCIGRLLLTAFVLAIPLSGFFLWPRLIEQLHEQTIQFYLTFLLKYTFTYFLTSFVAFALLRQIFFKIGLDNSAALGKAFQTREKHLVESGQLRNRSGNSSEGESYRVNSTVELGEI